MSEDRALPEELEAAVYEILFGDSDQDKAFADLKQKHPQHKQTLDELFQKLSSGMAAFPGWSNLDSDPQQIGPYRILEKLGEGGFGVVYLAEQRQPVKRRVALKCLLPGMDSRKVLARFEAERQALAMMSHPNIAQVFEVGATEKGRPYIVMEYVPGTPVTKFCDENKLSIRERLELFGQICEGVQHAHQKGIIHRDLKPSNILVNAKDGRPLPKIIDFGVAKALHQSLAVQTLFTERGRMLGTPEYMSPEQAAGRSDDIDTRCDIYSLGVLLYELLTATLPIDSKTFRDASLQEIQRVIQEQDPPRPSTRITSGDTRSGRTPPTTSADELRGDLDWVVMKALEKERARRYDSAAAFSDDIRRYLGHEPVRAHPPSRAYKVRKFVRRNRTGVLAASLIMLSLVLGLVGASWYYVEAKENLHKFEQLSDLVLVEECLEEEKLLWPEHPDSMPALQAWLDRARKLAARLPAHAMTLEEIGRRSSAAGGEPAEFADPRDRFLHQSVEELVQKLQEFTGKDGVLTSVEERLEFSKTVKQKTVDDHADMWKQATEAVAADPRFAGFELKPQVGLIPIGPDPDSKLWEFAHLRTGEPAVRPSPTALNYDAKKTGLIFVLIPGGTFWMGAQSKDPNGRHYYQKAHPFETPVHEVKLEPFFLSKFEMTQSQWLRVTGKNPSRGKPDTGEKFGRTIPRWHNPVENVSWNDCNALLHRLGLVLPTEAQWEYACRAGTDTNFYTGKEPASLKGHANLKDQASAEWFRAMGIGGTLEPIDDGESLHAPVTDVFPNPFGLTHMHGNMSEWTRDWIKLYDEAAARPGDGYRGDEPKDRKLKAVRGGSYFSRGWQTRASLRDGRDPDAREITIGVRPARELDK